MAAMCRYIVRERVHRRWHRRWRRCARMLRMATRMSCRSCGRHTQPDHKGCRRRQRDYHAGMVLLRAQRHMCRFRCPRSSPHHSTHAAPFSLCRTSHTAPTTRGGLEPRSARAVVHFLVQGSHPTSGRPSCPFLFAARCAAPACKHARTCSALRHARARARTRARTRTNDRRRTTRRAVRRRGAWLTGSLHKGGIRSVRSPLRRPPLLTTPTARPCKVAARKGPAFLFLKLPHCLAGSLTTHNSQEATSRHLLVRRRPTTNSARVSTRDFGAVVNLSSEVGVRSGASMSAISIMHARS